MNGGSKYIQSITLALFQVIQKLVALVGMLLVIFSRKQTEFIIQDVYREFLCDRCNEMDEASHNSLNQSLDMGQTSLYS